MIYTRKTYLERDRRRNKTHVVTRVWTRQNEWGTVDLAVKFGVTTIDVRCYHMRYSRSRGSTGRRFVHCSFGRRATGLVDGACDELGGIDVISEPLLRTAHPQRNHITLRYGVRDAAVDLSSLFFCGSGQST
jgi:hypothetical protein